MAATTYFPIAFASGGNTTPVPQTVQVDGSISYPEGYGPFYEDDILTNPDALPIGRTTYNQVLFDITTQLQLLSQYGAPQWITSDQNLGVPFPYPVAAVVYYSGARYENLTPANTATPGTDDTWLLTSGDATGVASGVVLDYAGFTAPSGYLSTDGSAVLRASYPTLLGAITQTQTGTTTNTLNTVSGLASTAQMYAGMPLESVNFPSGTTIASIVSGTAITASANATASGAVSIQFFNWGNGNGTTTFNIPLITSVTAGQGGTLLNNPGFNTTDIVGQSTGAATVSLVANNLPAHSHPGNGGNFLVETTGGNYGSGTSNLGLAANTGNNTTTNTPVSIVQPTVIMYKIIKT